MKKSEIFLVILCFLVASVLLNYNRTMKLLIEMLDENIPHYLTEDAKAIVIKKQNCRDYLTTYMKCAFLKCVKGCPSFKEFEALLSSQCFDKSQFDVIVGITSGGWIIAQMLSHILGKPRIKLTYSRYNNKTIAQKTAIFLKKKNSNENKIKLEPDTINKNQRVLLVDDTIGSGATMAHCKEYLLQKSKSVYTFAICAPKKHLVDQYIFESHFVIFPWGLDV